MKTIVFIGDSITYTNAGYATIASGYITEKNPGIYNVVNSGIGGNRVVDLYARWKKDCLNMSPDVISILIGVNDVWHEVESKNGVDADRFAEIYQMILEDTKKVLPNCRLMLLEPFVWNYGLTADNWDYISKEVKKRAEIIKELAEKYNAIFVPLQSALAKALDRAPAEFWTRDGIHPLASAHTVIAREWERCFEEIENLHEKELG